MYAKSTSGSSFVRGYEFHNAATGARVAMAAVIHTRIPSDPIHIALREYTRTFMAGTSPSRDFGLVIEPKPRAEVLDVDDHQAIGLLGEAALAAKFTYGSEAGDVYWFEPTLLDQYEALKGEHGSREAQYLFASWTTFQYLEQTNQDVLRRGSRQQLRDYLDAHRRRQPDAEKLSWMSLEHLECLHEQIFHETLDLGEVEILDRMYERTNWNRTAGPMSPTALSAQAFRDRTVGSMITKTSAAIDLEIIYGDVHTDAFLEAILRGLGQDATSDWDVREIHAVSERNGGYRLVASDVPTRLARTEHVAEAFPGLD